MAGRLTRRSLPGEERKGVFMWLRPGHVSPQWLVRMPATQRGGKDGHSLDSGDKTFPLTLFPFLLQPSSL